MFFKINQQLIIENLFRINLKYCTIMLILIIILSLYYLNFFYTYFQIKQIFRITNVYIFFKYLLIKLFIYKIK